MYKILNKFNASTDTIEQQIEVANMDTITGGACADRRFEDSLRYEITRTVVNILSQSVITYKGGSTIFCESLQRKLVDIYFALYEKGYCFLKFDADLRITNINYQSGTVKLVDKSYSICGITQKMAAKKALEMYGVITNAAFSVIDERGVLGIFSPAKDVIVKPGMVDKFLETMRTAFGVKSKQQKFAVTTVPMSYSGVTIPIKDLDLLTNKKDAVATVARLFNIQEDMIQAGSTYDNKNNAIIQTYSDFGGVIYDYITQIESQLISFRSVNAYTVEFPSVPQLKKPLAV